MLVVRALPWNLKIMLLIFLILHCLMLDLITGGIDFKYQIQNPLVLLCNYVIAQYYSMNFLTTSRVDITGINSRLF